MIVSARQVSSSLRVIVGFLFVCVAGWPDALWAWSQETTTANGTIGLRQTGVTVHFDIAEHGCFDNPCFSDAPGGGEAGVIAIEDSLASMNSVINPQFTITSARFTMSATPNTIDSENGRTTCTTLGKTNCIYFFKLDANNSFGGIAAAFISFNPATGAITGCDVLFDDASLNFSTTGAVGAFDVEGIANQEIGHCLGLDHSGIAGAFSPTTGLQVDGFAPGGNFTLTASMFPYADDGVTAAQSLESDDDAGMLALYPPAAPTGNGSISGQVVNGTTGQPVKGAHVVAVSTVSSSTPIVGSLSGVMPNATPGSYRLDSLPPGTYYVRIEPLVGTTNSFTEVNTDASGFDTSFPAEFYGGESSEDLDFTKDGAGALADAVANGTVTVVANMDTPNIDFETNMLAAPSGLTATLDTVTPAVDLAWADNSINEDGFAIERRTGGGVFAQIATVSQDVEAFTDLTVVKGTNYSYRVRAFNSARDSAYTALVTLCVLCGGGGGGCGSVAPVGPSAPPGPAGAALFLLVLFSPLLVALARRGGLALKRNRPARGRTRP